MFQPQPNEMPVEAEIAAPEESMSMAPVEGEIAPEEGGEMTGGITPEEIEAHMDSLPDEEKAFLAEYLTPEFIRAISLISGTEVGTYLNQFADKEKVLIPVPRQMAEEYLAKQQATQSAPQGATQAPAMAPPAPAPQAMPQMPPQGMMAPA